MTHSFTQRTEHAHHQGGFSLVELSIVLVVIGLLMGGIMVGENLYSNVRLKGVITEQAEFKQAIANFRQKYKYWPGDLPDANLLRGSAFPTGAGNGDDKIGGDITTNADEVQFFWEQLSAAKMIAGGYIPRSGTTTPTGDYRSLVIGTNVPRTRLSDDGSWSVQTPYFVPAANFSNAFARTVGFDLNNTAKDFRRNTSFLLVAGGTATNALTGIMSPEQAESIDIKLDDTRPGTGKVQANNSIGADAACATTAVAATALYDLASTQLQCMLFFAHVLE